MKHILLILILAISSLTVFAQPPNDNCANADPLVVDAPCQPGTNINATNDGNPSCGIFSFLAGKTVWFSFVATGPNTQISVTGVNGDLDVIMSVFTSCGGNSLNCVNANGADQNESTVLNTVSGNTYYVMIDGYGGILGFGAHKDGNFCIQVSTYIAPPNPSGDCAGAQPFCTGSTYAFPAATNTQSQAGPNYGCLGTQPNPAWYYVKIATTGSIDIHMASDANQDIDFICWGPFTSPPTACTILIGGGGAQVDCSFSTAAEEDCNIPNGQVGEYYMLLITNYSNQPTNIIFSQTGGTGATDCSIINPIIAQNNGPLCPGQTLALTATNVSGATYSWTGPNGFTSAIRNPTITNATPAATGLYTLVTTIGANTYSSTTTATVFSALSPECVMSVICTADAIANPDTICAGSTTNLTASGGIFRAVLSNTFDNGTVGVGWVGTPTANFTNQACAGPPPFGVGNIFLWMDNTTPAPRRLESNDFNVINGGVISFWLKYAVQGQGVPCEGPDENGEGVILQYSTTSGTSWNDITYFNPNGTQMLTNPDAGYTNHTTVAAGSTAFTSWARYSFPIPAGASTTSTRFRWYQKNSTSASTDNWGLDSVLIKTAYPGLTYTWGLNGNIIGTGTSLNVAPTVTSTYYVTVSDGTYSCDDSVKVVVYTVNAAFSVNDSTQCKSGNSFTFTNLGSSQVGTVHTWNFGDGTATSNLTNPTHSYNNAGNFLVTHTVNVGTCTDSIKHSVFIYSEPSLTFDSISSCADTCNGSLKANPVGNGPFSYLWANGSTNQTLTAICSGYYGLVVTDKYGCDTSKTGHVPLFVAPTVLITQKSSCSNICNGSLTAAGAGTVPPYQYIWSEGTNQATASQLCPGVYLVTVTDNNGCSVIGIKNVILYPSIDITTSSDSVKCFSQNNGAAHVINVTGGGGPNSFTYQWSVNAGGQIGPDAIGLFAGTYRVTVTDTSGCKADTIATVFEPNELMVLATPDTHLCYHSDGYLYAGAIGGTMPYLYHWTNNINTDTIYTSNIVISPESTCFYAVYVTDINNCVSKKQNISVTVDPKLTIHLSANDTIVCPGSYALMDAWLNGGDSGPYYVFDSEWNQIDLLPYKVYPTEDSSMYIVTGMDNCGASARDTITLYLHPQPKINFTSNKFFGCQPLLVKFNEGTNNPGASYLWNFNDAESNISQQRNPTHTFETSGVFDISLSITSKNGCESTRTEPAMITVYPKPDARFIATPDLASIIEPEVVFTNYSEGYLTSFWDFGDGDSSQYNDPIHVYKSAGKFKIQLIVVSDHGCSDTTSLTYFVRDEYSFYAPSAFSPDQNGINDIFNVYGRGIKPTKFVLSIYDRWGELIFETTKLDQGWDGRVEKSSSGKDVAKSGVYTWFVVYTDLSGVVHQKTGPVTLLH